MRSLIALLAVTAPAAAWEFTPTPVCTLSHSTSAAEVTVTYDPRAAEPYAIALTGAGWPDAPVFAIRFSGPRGLTITTDRHRLSESGATLTVSDRGFGNVLNGLEFNETATALIGDRTVTLQLEGASEPVRAFRACAEAPLA
ncbi:MAG: excinuclease ABC subunit B [Paracoccaceae bacterium]|nr:excinuclease ABC subunit B [Paracoccaceae bacterium]